MKYGNYFQTKKYMQLPFHEVGELHAYKEREGDRTLTYWRNVHEKFFTECFMEIGLKFYTDTQVVCEEFEAVQRI